MPATVCACSTTLMTSILNAKPPAQGDPFLPISAESGMWGVTALYPMRLSAVRAERASEAKSRLLANVAHEIKSPVGGVIGIGELWKSGQLGPITETQTEMAEMLVKTARQVEALTHDLLDVARAESGAVKLDLRPTDVPGILEDGENGLPGSFRQLMQRLGDHLKELDRQVGQLEREIQQWHRANEDSCRLAEIPGVRPITASALVASIGDAKSFANGRQMAAWLGLVPRQHSSGGKPTLLGISKRGDPYLRTLLIQGARAVLRVAERKANYAGSWLANLLGRRNQNVAAVALANKNARIIWALLAHDRDYKAGLQTAGDIKLRLVIPKIQR